LDAAIEFLVVQKKFIHDLSTLWVLLDHGRLETIKLSKVITFRLYNNIEMNIAKINQIIKQKKKFIEWKVQ